MTGRANSIAAIRRRGIMLILSSPSGAGKTTISRALLDSDTELTLSVSVTTRPPRPGERDGADYRFIDAAEFERMAQKGELLEHAEVFGHRYGSPREPVEAALAAGHDVLFDIDWQGAQQLAQSAGDDLVSIFILPPSTSELARRLETRAQDSAEVVRGRMAQATDEVSHWAEYDYIVINEDIADSVAKVGSILAAERLKRARQVGLPDFVNRLREG